MRLPVSHGGDIGDVSDHLLPNTSETQIATPSLAYEAIKMKVAAVQLGLFPGNPEKAVAKAELQVRAASTSDAALICLPEHWLQSRVLTSRDTIINRFARLAKELGVYLNLGANYERRGEVTWITSHTISPSGDIISRQDKVHLYREETEKALPGSGFELVDVAGMKVAVLVCHDIVFPEAARTVTLMGAGLLVVPSLIIARGSEPWLVYLRARCLENRLPIISPNVYHPPKFLGRSCILDLRYDSREHVMQLVERKAHPREVALSAELDLKSKLPLRKERLRELLRSNAIWSLYSTSKTNG
jgi:predicted amidohydrolase